MEARIIIEQKRLMTGYERLTIINQTYKIKDFKELNVEKLSQSITKAVFRRYAAEKSKDRLKFGFNVSRPLFLSVIMDGRYIIHTGEQENIKINPALCFADHKKAKKRFQDSILKILKN